MNDILLAHPTHIALDLALGTTGIAWGPCDYTRETSPTNLTNQQRLTWWQHTIRYWLLPHPEGTPLIIEAPITGHATGNIETHRLHGIIAGVAADNQSPITYIHPSTLKKWAAGTGRATKDEMRIAAIDRWGAHHTITHDEADALHLWHYHDNHPHRETT